MIKDGWYIYLFLCLYPKKGDFSLIKVHPPFGGKKKKKIPNGPMAGCPAPKRQTSWLGLETSDHQAGADGGGRDVNGVKPGFP